MMQAGTSSGISFRATHLIAAVRSSAAFLWRVFSFSAADESLAHRKALAAVIDKGILSLAAGSRSFSHLKIHAPREILYDTTAYPAPEAVASALSLELKTLKWDAPLVGFVIPRAWTVVSITDFPTSVKENLAEVVRFEIDRITPFHASDALYDYQVIRESEGKLRILVVAARADLIRPYIEAFRAQGISVSSVSSPLTALPAGLAHDSGERDFIAIGETAGNIEGSLVLGRRLHTLFNLPQGLDIQALSDRLVALLDAASVHLDRHQALFPVWYFGEKDTATEKLLRQIPWISFRLTEQSIASSPSALGLPTHTEHVRGSLLALLWPKACTMNILSLGRRPHAKTPLFLTCVLIIAVISAFFAYAYKPLLSVRDRAAEIDAQIVAAKDEVRKVESLKKEVGTIAEEIQVVRSFKDNRPITVNIVREITALLPSNAWLSRLRITELTVDLEGYAGSATELIPKLEASPYFSKVELGSTIFRDQRLNADRFVIKMNLDTVKSQQTTGGDAHGKE